MYGAKVVLVNKASDQQLPDPTTTIASPVPTGSLQDQAAGHGQAGGLLSESTELGRGVIVAKSAEFYVG